MFDPSVLPTAGVLPVNTASIEMNMLSPGDLPQLPPPPKFTATVDGLQMDMLWPGDVWPSPPPKITATVIFTDDLPLPTGPKITWPDDLPPPTGPKNSS